MKNKQLYLYWLYIYILCAALGFIQERSILVSVLLAIACLLFFLPPALLLYRNRTEGKPLVTVAVLGGCSLVLTMVLFIAYWYVLVASGSDLWSNVMYALLTVLSAPMMCAPWPALSMFLWACLTFTALSFLNKQKKTRK